MKKFILKKIFMLVYFLDRAKEQQLIRHNPCLFKIDSPYKVSVLNGHYTGIYCLLITSA